MVLNVKDCWTPNVGVFSMRVLLVEDDASTVKIFELVLKSECFVVDSTALGEEGLEAV